MRKAWILLLGLVMGLTSCHFEDVFTATNLRAFVTVKEGTLVDDTGGSCSIVQDGTDGAWKTEDARLYILYDILNRNWDIALKGYLTCIIQNTEPAPVVEEGEEVQEVQLDPIIPVDHSFGGGYFNFVLDYYLLPGAETPHDMHLYAGKNGAEDALMLRLIHEGNGENPAAMSIDQLKTARRAYCFPISTTLSNIYLTLPILYRNENDEYIVQEMTYSFTNSSN